MIRLKQALVVEGKYDKIKLQSVVDAEIIVTNGFMIYKDKEKLELIRKYAHTVGIIVLTDSDDAGRQIRNYLSNTVGGNITNIYIPEIFGKEKRKATASKSGMLGVEGMDVQLLREAFAKFGIMNSEEAHINDGITREELFDDGLIGGDGSKSRRQDVLKQLGLPSNLSSSAMLSAINQLYNKDEYKRAVLAAKDGVL